MTALYYEVLANLTWYQLNSEYNDPMYQYMNKLERELYLKIMVPLSAKNYSVLDDFVLFDRKQIPRYGTYQCSAPEKEAYMDTAFSCFLFQLPFFLENIQIGFIGFAVVIPIMLISIFGGIKESYRWFILNQAIWDLFLCYDFICSPPTLFGWSKNYFLQTTCFYSKNFTENDYGFVLNMLMAGFKLFLRNASFIPVFHLAFSRFVCMYFPRFYKSFTKNGYKILIFFLIFNIICIGIFCTAATTFTTSVFNVINALEEKCGYICPSGNTTYCNQNIPKFFQCQNRIAYDFRVSAIDQQTYNKIFKYVTFSIPPVMFLLSIICAGFLFYKIASQLKFQLNTNPESFKQTIKISSVIGFQCLTMSVIFLITGIQKFMRVKSEAVVTLKIYDELPPWLFLLQHVSTTTSLNMIRIILDSFIILSVLTDYTKCVVLTLKFAYLCLISPKKAYKSAKSYTKGESITVVSTFKK